MTVSTTIPLTPTSPPASGTAIPHTIRTTCWDLIEYLQDFEGANPSQELYRAAKRSIQAALRDMVNAFNWSYLYQHGRVYTHGHYTTGTIQVQVSSGTYANQVTLTGGTFPSWTQYGCIRIGTVTYDVDQYINATTCTLKAGLAPVVDVAAGTAYDLYQDAYTLPADFVAMDQGLSDSTLGAMGFVHPSLWLETVRAMQSYSNMPRWYTIMGDPKIPNRLCFRVFPYPDTDRTIDFIYKRRPRAVTIDQITAGK